MLKNILTSKDLRSKIAFTLLLLLLYRIGNFIPVPGINSEVLKDLTNQADILGLINTFSGGALASFSLFAVGIMPYITASIVIQLLSMDVFPYFTELSKQGEYGRKKMKRITRGLTVVIAFVQSIVMSFGFNRMYPGLVENQSVGSYLLIACILTLGTVVLMIMGEVITKKGIGNGISLIIFAGIVSTIPQQVVMLYAQEFTDTDSLFISIVKVALLLLGLFLITIAVVYVQKAQRKIPIKYSKEGSIKNRIAEKQGSFLPIPLNVAGVIPVIFAVAIFMTPPTIARFFGNHEVVNWVVNTFDYTKPVGMIVYALLIMAFTYFYAFVQFNPEKVATNLKKQGSYIPGYRPGHPTEEYIEGTVKRLAFVGGIFLAILSVLPIIVTMFSGLPPQVQIGGVSLIIIVSVALDTMKQIESKTFTKKYRKLIK